MQKILLIGQDSQILDHHATLLEASGVSVDCCPAAELVFDLSGDFDLIILYCPDQPSDLHSLVMSDIYRRWPQTPVLRVVAGEDSYASVDADMSLVQPGPLLYLAEQLLEDAGAKPRWHRAPKTRQVPKAA